MDSIVYCKERMFISIQIKLPEFPMISGNPSLMINIRESVCSYDVELNYLLNFVTYLFSFISVSLGAVTAGTILAWTSPVLSQLQANVTNPENISSLINDGMYQMNV